MLDDATLLALAEELLPGAGFFGGTEAFALSLDINETVDRVEIAIERGAPEWLNLKALLFYDRNGRPLDKVALLRSAVLSTIHRAASPETVFSRVITGNTIRSERELRPTLGIQFHAPTDIGRIVILSRPDLRSRRSRYLTCTAFHRGQTVFRYVNLSKQSQLLEVRALLALCGMPHERLASLGAIGNMVTEVRTALMKRLEQAPLDWTPRQVAALLPLFAVTEVPTDFQISLCANIMLSVCGTRDHCETPSLAPLQGILSSARNIRRMTAEAGRLLEKRGGPPRIFQATKHVIQESFLERDRDRFLAALDAIFPLMSQMGVDAMLCYGTLLGAVRENRFLQHDDDVDILYVDGSSTREEALQGKAELVARLRAAGYSTSDTKENFHVVVGQAAIDVFFCWAADGRLTLMMENYRYRDIAAEIVLPPSTVSLYDRVYPAPANPAGLLAERYGQGWTTSNPYHEWPWPLMEEAGAPPADTRTRPTSP